MQRLDSSCLPQPPSDAGCAHTRSPQGPPTRGLCVAAAFRRLWKRRLHPLLIPIVRRASWSHRQMNFKQK